MKEVPEPIYYFGWVIQPTPYGFYVYSRRGYPTTRGGMGKLFPSLEEAEEWILKEVKINGRAEKGT